MVDNEKRESRLKAELKFFFNVIKESLEHPTSGSVVISTTSGSVVESPNTRLKKEPRLIGQTNV